jgi:hypothetical protein
MPNPTLLRLFAALPLFVLLASAACRTMPMITPDPIPAPLGAEHNRTAILRGMTIHRWTLQEELPGALVLRQSKADRHVAVVNVAYDDDSIDITYLGSEGLQCMPQGESCSEIHRAYNRWVVQLAEDIRYGIELVRLESVAAEPAAVEP